MGWRNYKNDAQAGLGREAGELEASGAGLGGDSHGLGGDAGPGDSDLLRRASQGDHRAFEALIDLHAPGLHRAALAMLGNAADAQDLVQETFLGAYEGMGRFRGEASVRTWLTRILTLKVAEHRRRGKYRKTQALEAMDPVQAAASLGRAGDQGGSDARMDVAALLDKLSPEHRDVIVLRELQGLSYEEAAVVLGVPKGTVESRLFRARQALKAAAGA